MAQPVAAPQVIYLVERQPPPQAVEESDSCIESIKQVAGVILAALGLAIIAGATITLGLYLTAGNITVTMETIHSFFLTGVVCAVGGFHLAGGKSAPSTDLNAGPLTLSI